MTTRQKLEIIQRMLGLTQTKLAERFGVSFATFNSWWTGKSNPRPKMQASIDPAIIRQEQKQLYYTYLYKAQTKDDQSQLEDFLCEAIMDGFKILDRTDVR